MGACRTGIFLQKGDQHAEHTRNHLKKYTSLKLCGSGVCKTLLLNVVCKGKGRKVYAAWCRGGMKNARYSGRKPWLTGLSTCSCLWARYPWGRFCCWEITFLVTSSLKSSISARSITLHFMSLCQLETKCSHWQCCRAETNSFSSSSSSGFQKVSAPEPAPTPT